MARKIIPTIKVVAGILKQEIEVQMIDLFAGEQKQEWFLKMNPKHQVPVLAIDEKTFISESVVICQYLCKVAGQNSLYPGKHNLSRHHDPLLLPDPGRPHAATYDR